MMALPRKFFILSETTELLIMTWVLRIIVRPTWVLMLVIGCRSRRQRFILVARGFFDDTNTKAYSAHQTHLATPIKSSIIFFLHQNPVLEVWYPPFTMLRSILVLSSKHLETCLCVSVARPASDYLAIWRTSKWTCGSRCWQDHSRSNREASRPRRCATIPSPWLHSWSGSTATTAYYRRVQSGMDDWRRQAASSPKREEVRWCHRS